MKNKIIPMLGVAAIFGSLSIFAANMWLEQAVEERSLKPETNVQALAPKIEFGTIVVAAEELRYGRALDASALREIPWPTGDLPQGAYASVQDALKEGNRVVLSLIAHNEPVLLSKLSGPNGKATLSNKLTPGMQAITVPTDNVTGVGGFITAGDRVDVVLTRDGGKAIAQNEGNEIQLDASGAKMITETIVSGARVVSAGGPDEDGSRPVSGPQAVTLEVSPSDARRIALARTVGQISLSLLAAGNSENSNSASATLSSLSGFISNEKTSALKSDVTPSETRKLGLTEVKVTRGLQAETYSVPETISHDGGQ